MTTISAGEMTWRGAERRRVLAVLAAGAVATGVTGWACARSPILADPAGTAAWRSAFVASYIGVGVYSWWRQPESRLGPLVAGVGFLYSVASLNAFGAPLAYTIGMVVWVAVIVYLAYVYLCFPDGRLESRLERWFVLGLVTSTAVVWALILALSPTLPPGGSFSYCGTSCPPNALQIVDGHAGTAVALNAVFNVVTTVSLIGIAMLIFNKARSSAQITRRAMIPLTVAFIANIVEFVTFLFVGPAYPDTKEAFRIVDGIVTLAVPIAIVVGQARAHAYATTNLGQLAARASLDSLRPPAIQQLIGETLGDRTLRLVMWDREAATYVDVYGAPAQVKSNGDTRGITVVTRDGSPVAALIHNPSLHVDSDIAEDLAATLLMLLENWRLVQELRASRARLVTAEERERHRVERDLHDGAQQSLLGIQLRVAMAREAADSKDVARQLDAIERDAETALQELRKLAHGVYPTVLHDFGVAAALRDMSRTAPVPVRVVDEGVGRYSEAIEAAIYFCAREAIQNAAKHAGPTATVTTTVSSNNGTVEVTIADDGVGMTPDLAANGTGIVGMRDRIEAVGGLLDIVSAPKQGTSVHATIPSTMGPDTRAPTRQRSHSPGRERSR